MRDAVLNEGMGDIFSDREEKEKKRLTVTRHRSSHDRMLNAHHCFHARHNIQLMIKDSFINLLDRVCITFYVPTSCSSSLHDLGMVIRSHISPIAMTSLSPAIASSF